MKKPLLLEALVKYISHSKLGIDEAINTVFKKSNEELLVFLYDDAWIRMNEFQKEVFLILVHAATPLDQNCIGQTCQEIGISHSEFLAALEETHFAIQTDYGQNYSLELIDLARRFFLQQFSKLQEPEKKRLKEISLKIDNYAKQREQVDKDYRTDRVAEAFRSDFAKAAKVCAEKGNIKEAIEMYKLSIEDDPVNSALHDRFSWLILNKTQDFEYAKELSLKAVYLDSKNCDATVGLALVYYRVGDIGNGDSYIDKAEKLGRPKSFCLLRKSIARYHKSKKVDNLEISILMLESGLEKLIEAEKSITSRKRNIAYGYEAKNLENIIRYLGLTRSRLTILRTRKTKGMA